MATYSPSIERHVISNPAFFENHVQSALPVQPVEAHPIDDTLASMHVARSVAEFALVELLFSSEETAMTRMVRNEIVHRANFSPLAHVQSFYGSLNRNPSIVEALISSRTLLDKWLALSLDTEYFLLEQSYRIPDAKAVHAYVVERPGLISALLQTFGLLDHYFPRSTATLEVKYDRDIPDYSQLVLTISVDYDALEAMDRLDRFETHWWQNLPRFVRKSLTLALEFR